MRKPWSDLYAAIIAIPTENMQFVLRKALKRHQQRSCRCLKTPPVQKMLHKHNIVLNKIQGVYTKILTLSPGFIQISFKLDFYEVFKEHGEYQKVLLTFISYMMLHYLAYSILSPILFLYALWRLLYYLLFFYFSQQL